MIKTNLLNFTVGPVQSSESVREIGKLNVPYFRTPEFSELMLENECLMKKFVKANEASRVCFMTASGTGSMEAVVINCFTIDDKLLIVNGGSFGERFVELAKIHEIPYEEISLSHGESLKPSHLEPFTGKGFTGMLINIDETSTGVLYDIKLVSKFCKDNNIFLVVDAISSFLCDDLNMEVDGFQVLITGSQKALACPPGISIIVLSPEAISKIMSNRPKCMYLDLKSALQNGERGQTPFTPAVQTLIQINCRLNEIERAGGVEAEIKRCADLAADFREQIKGLPLEICSESLSNAVTPLHPAKSNAYEIFTTLKNEYGIWICPNGGTMKDEIFRVGHLGCLSSEDNVTLVKALKELNKRGIL